MIVNGVPIAIGRAIVNFMKSMRSSIGCRRDKACLVSTINRAWSDTNSFVIHPPSLTIDYSPPDSYRDTIHYFRSPKSNLDT